MLHLRFVVYIEISISIPSYYFLRGNQENEEIPALMESRDKRCVSKESVLQKSNRTKLNKKTNKLDTEIAVLRLNVHWKPIMVF